jgi:hypothetical protein
MAMWYAFLLKFIHPNLRNDISQNFVVDVFDHFSQL